MLRRKKSLKRNLKPFGRYEEASMKSKLPAYEMLIFIIAFCQLCFLLYIIIKALI